MAEMTSPARQLAEQLVPMGAGAQAALVRVLAQMTVTEMALVARAWRQFWARPKQLIGDGQWRSWGFLTGRRFGKTRAIAEWINEQVELGKARRIGFCAQTTEDGEDVIIHGECGLVATSPPWNRAEWVAGEVRWPNGAVGRLFTPERPEKYRGPGLNIFWASELQSWSRARTSSGDLKLLEAFTNAELMTTQGIARVVWDATPKRRHPLIRELIARHEAAPETHCIVRGRIEENADNLGKGAVADLRRQFGQTKKAREELDGEFLDEDEGALWEQAWIDAHRREMPTELKRRIIAIDPAISDRAGTDQTGFVDLGLCVDDQVVVFADLSGTYVWEHWGRMAVRLYVSHAMDCIVVERNRGGDACVANIRACAQAVGWRVEVLKRDARTRHQNGVIYIKEVFSSKGKGTRAEPVATLYEQGRVSHLIGAELLELEDVMTTWNPDESEESPDALDALVHGVTELAELHTTKVDYSKGMKGLDKVAEVLRQSSKARDVRALLMGDSSGWGDKL